MIPKTRAWPASCRWSELALLGVAGNLVILTATPFLRPDLNLSQRSLSFYAIGPWGAVQAAGFAVLALSSLALAAAFWRSGVASPWLRLAVSLIVVAGMASLGLVDYPMGSGRPATILGDAHQRAGTTGGAAELAATFAFILAVRTELDWAGLLPVAALALIAALAGAVISRMALWWPERGIPMGATIRLVMTPPLLLWGLVALRLRQRCVRSSADPPA